MLVQDALTGALHEVPEGALYGDPYGEYPEQLGEPVYDGLGNPVGFSFLAPLASALLPKVASIIPSIASKVLPQVGRIVGSLTGMAPPAAPPVAPVMAPPPVVRTVAPAVPPPGWIPRPVPFTGQPGRRMYMRCAVWHAPGGLIPAFAAQPYPAVPAAPISPAVAAAVRHRHRRR